MNVLQQRRAIVWLALLAAFGMGMAACADQVAAPQRNALQPTKAQHDDPPPDVYCATGWQDVEGIWVCPP